MPSAREAREWAADGGLHGIGNSLYTPFSGHDGDGIDFDAYRTLVRYCVGDLQHSMLWLTSGLAEWWTLTLSERKALVEVAIQEARAIAPKTVIQVCTTAMTAKDTVELTLHAQKHGADMCYIQTPTMEVHAGEGVLRFYQYVADRTDIALGIFDSPSSGYVLTPKEVAEIYQKNPAVISMKEGVLEPRRASAIHNLAPGLQIWECDSIAYRAGWLQLGIVAPAQLGTTGYLFETPDRPIYTQFWQMIWDNRLSDAIKHAEESGMDRLPQEMGGWHTMYPGRPHYFTHWGESFKYAASVIGLPIGDYPHSRPPQGILPEAAKVQIKRALDNAGFSGGAARYIAKHPQRVLAAQ
jgi:4-hydroxy-tetrahydrodipicolinate synthase